jgi:hypothetical protein
MDTNRIGAVRGCLFALFFEACLLVAGWLAWRLLRIAFG